MNYIQGINYYNNLKINKDVTEWKQLVQNNREEAKQQGSQTKRYSSKFQAYGSVYMGDRIICNSELIDPTTFKYSQ